MYEPFGGLGTVGVALFERGYILDLSAVCLTRKAVVPEFQDKWRPIMGGQVWFFQLQQCLSVPQPLVGPVSAPSFTD